jgi:hypothetical protein
MAVIVALMHWFVTRFGLHGAVFTALVAAAVFKGTAVARVARLMHLGPRDILPWRALARIVAATLLATVPAVMFRAEFLHWPPLVLGAATTIVFATVYLPVVAAWGLVPMTVWSRFVLRFTRLRARAEA